MGYPVRNTVLGVLLAAVAACGAQNLTISGVVKSAVTRKPLPLVRVSVRGINGASYTDMLGQFKLPVLKNDTVCFHATGYHDEQLVVQGCAKLDVGLTPRRDDTSRVNVGYGTTRRSSLSTAVGTVDSSSIDRASGSGVNGALQGRVAGVSVRSSGDNGSRVTIRGAASFFGNTVPLYVLDGVVVSAEVAASLDPNEIAEVSVLKDAASAAIYGVQAANGVILISTKASRMRR